MGQPPPPDEEEGVPDLLARERFVAERMRYMNLRFDKWFEDFWEDS
jgi:hypothetical protein